MDRPDTSPPFLPLPSRPTIQPRDDSLGLINAMVRLMDKALHCYHSVEVKAVRQSTGQSQRAFADRFGLSPRTVEQWESSRRQPDRAATALLKTIAYAPEIVEAALNASPDMMTMMNENENEDD